MEYLPLYEKYMAYNKEIENINYLLTKFHDNVIKIKHEKLVDSIAKFKSIYEYYYSKFTGLKRFSIPVFGKILSHRGLADG